MITQYTEIESQQVNLSLFLNVLILSEFWAERMQTPLQSVDVNDA